MNNDFEMYMLAQSTLREAIERRNYADAALELAQIRERLAKIKSQNEPLNGLIAQQLGERDRLYSAAFYVVVGRMPTTICEPDATERVEG